VRTTKVGLLVAAALALLMGAIVTLGQQEHFWERKVRYEMHFARTNQLTLASFDRRSRQPSYKACAVKVHPLPEGDPNGEEGTAK